MARRARSTLPRLRMTVGAFLASVFLFTAMIIGGFVLHDQSLHDACTASADNRAVLRELIENVERRFPDAAPALAPTYRRIESEPRC